MNSFGKVKWKLRYYGVKMLGKIPGFLDGDQYYCNRADQHLDFLCHMERRVK